MVFLHIWTRVLILAGPTAGSQVAGLILMLAHCHPLSLGMFWVVWAPLYSSLVVCVSALPRWD